MTGDSWLQEAGRRGGVISKRLSDLGIERAAAMLCEGHCPICEGRSSDTPPFEPPEDERTPQAVVNCMSCNLRWLSGINADNGMDWVEYTQASANMTLSTCVNPPPIDGDDEDWE